MAANQTIRWTWLGISLCFHSSSLLKSHCQILTFPQQDQRAPDMRNLFRTFNSLLCPPPPPPTTSITADRLCHFFHRQKLEQSVNQFSPPHTQDLQPTTSTAQLPSSPSVPFTEAEYPNFSLQPSYNMSSWPNPLSPSPSNLSHTLTPALTHIINTSLHTGIFPTAFKQARVTPLLKKPTLNTSLLENYRPVSLLPFVAKTLERVVFNQLSLFLSQYNKLGC